MNRRNLLKAAAAGLLTGASLETLAKPVSRAACLQTPAQSEGPFYPIHQQADKDLDLTQIKGHKKHASGEIIIIDGELIDRNCDPISNAKIEIWQANKWGRYQHKRDSNKAPLDPDFQGWGIMTTDAKGKFRFKTILPGAYPATTDWTRPPHIHVKIHGPKHKSLTTQIYFEGQALNSNDKILMGLSTKQQKSVISKAQQNKLDQWPVYHYSLVL